MRDVIKKITKEDRVTSISNIVFILLFGIFLGFELLMILISIVLGLNFISEIIGIILISLFIYFCFKNIRKV